MLKLLFLFIRVFVLPPSFSMPEEEDDIESDAAQKRHGAPPKVKKEPPAHETPEQKAEAEEAARLKAEEDEKKKKAGQNGKDDDQGEGKEKEKDGAGEDEGVMIGDKKLSGEEYIAAYDKVKADLGDDFDGLSESAQHKLLLKEHNLILASKAADGRHQANAETKRQLEKEREALTKEFGEMKTGWTQLNKEQAEFDERKKERAEEKSTLEKVIEKRPEDIVDDDERENLKDEIKDAKKRLKEIEKEETKDTKKAGELKEQREKMVEDNGVLYLQYNINLFLDAYPEFIPAKPFEELNSKTTAYKGIEQDRKRKKVFDQIFNDYVNEDEDYKKTHTIADYAKEYGELYPGFAIVQKFSAGDGKKKEEETKPKTAKERYEELKAKQKGAPPPPGGGASYDRVAGLDDEDDEVDAGAAAKRHMANKKRN